MLESSTKTFISTRPTGKSDELKELIESQGGQLLELPMIRIRAAELNATKQELLRQAPLYDWILFTSANGVTHFFEALQGLGIATAALLALKFAAIGKATTNTLNRHGFVPSFVPSKATGSDFAQELKALFGHARLKVLWPTGHLAPDTLPQVLGAFANLARVNVYQTLAPEIVPEDILNRLKKRDYVLIYFYSPSAVNNFVDLLGPQLALPELRVACIGPVTAQACRQWGIEPRLVAEKHQTDRLWELTQAHFLA